MFERGVDAPTLDATVQPARPVRFRDHDVAVYAENLWRQIGDTSLLPWHRRGDRSSQRVRQRDPRRRRLAWAVGTGASTDAEIEAFLVESNITYEDVIALLVTLLDQLGYDRLVAILQGRVGPGALAIATSVRSGVSVVDLPALAVRC